MRDVTRSASLAALAILATGGWAWSHKAAATASTSTESSVTDASGALGAALNLKVNADLVQIPVTVTNKADEAVFGLTRDNFAIYENGVEQTIVHFDVSQAPISACLVFDASQSMERKLESAEDAVARVLNSAQDQDEYCLIRFSDWPEKMVSLTNDSSRIKMALRSIQPDGLTALLDAVNTALVELREAHNRHKAIILISDGGDNRSRLTQGEIKQLVKEADVQVYSIGLVSLEDRWVSPEEINGPALMKSLSQQTGGRFFQIHQLEDLQSAADKINSALRNQYVLGYYPKKFSNDGKFRRVGVKLSPPKGFPRLRAYWRPGYYAPKE
ncbi:MAG TPA: VWA domain-containing protein [Bryobacteraceae bacterium]|nr:VWA domain-containing protein [Bryobacteraceae bacterium]